MVDQNLIAELDSVGGGLDAELAALFGNAENATLVEKIIGENEEEYKPGTILKGIVVGRAGDDIVVDVGLKSEGLIPAEEWDDSGPVDLGDEVQVWLETVESDSGHIIISKRKADRILNWQRILTSKKDGDSVEGRAFHRDGRLRKQLGPNRQRSSADLGRACLSGARR